MSDASQAWHRCIAEQFLGVRPVPSPTRHAARHVYALVPDAHHIPGLDLSPVDTDVLDVAAAATAHDALHDLTEAAVATRLRAHGVDTTGLGAGRDWSAAVTRGVYRLLERDALAQVRSNAGAAGQITGWAPARGGPTAEMADALTATHGWLDWYLFPSLSAVPALGAVLRLTDPAGRLCALACDLDVERAAATALRRLLRTLVVLMLLRGRSPVNDPRLDRPWVHAALDAAAGDAVPPAGSPAAEAAREIAGEPPLPPRAGAAGVLDALRERLRAHGLSTRARVIYPADHTPDADTPVTVVQCQLAGLPTESHDAGDTSGTGTVWDPPDVTGLGLRLPHQTTLGFDESHVRISRVYHENSKIHTLYRDQPHFAMSDLPVPLHRVLGRAVRDYRPTPLEYGFPPCDGIATPPIEHVVARRRSWATITDAPLTLAELGHLLRYSYGVTGTALISGSDARMPLRAVPAAGGLYSNDLYLLLERVHGVEPGLYYYQPLRHRLELVRADRRLGEVAEYTGYAERVRQAAAVAIYVGSLRRLQWKYWERGYRMSLLDCGHLAQNVVLMANALGMVAHPMIAYVDDYFNDLVGVDGVDDVVLYLTLLGRGAAAEARTAPTRAVTEPDTEQPQPQEREASR